MSELKRHARFMDFFSVRASTSSEYIFKVINQSLKGGDSSLISWKFKKMEDSAFGNQRIVKRRATGGALAEVRRLHIVYFLSRKGCDEHPHLIRIHHLSKNGVRLKDIKRWLGELRGKGMPELFAWSYKRRYKTGYVWQDLVDDDLVTPISDNEYVLKGSEISSTNNIDFSRTPMQKEQLSPHESASEILTHSPKSSSATFGSESSTLTDELENNSDKVDQDSSDKRQFKKSHSSGIFRNLITCGKMDTSDSVVVMTNKRHCKPFLNMCSSSVGVKNSAKEKPHASYRPRCGPNCSQCGERFKPEKLYAHMKFCKGMKANKPAPLSAAGNISRNDDDSVSGYLLVR